MALNSSQVTAITDSVSQALSDFNTCFIANTGTSTPSSTTIINGVSGTTTSNTLGRVLNYLDIVPELNMLTAANTMATNVTAYIGGLQAISGFYPQFYPIFDKLDSTLTGGLNAFLTANTIQVNARFAAAFNYWAAIATAVTPGRTSANAPIAIATANYFPYAATDSLWTFTCGAGTTMSASAVGTNASTTVNGGGVGQMYLYKSNSSNAVGGATFTVTYTTAAGTSTTATYTTTSGVPLASGSLAAGYSITGAIGSAVTGVTGTGMTSGEQYTIGMKLVRALSGY
jgi:hypothetical protein